MASSKQPRGLAILVLGPVLFAAACGGAAPRAPKPAAASSASTAQGTKAPAPAASGTPALQKVDLRFDWLVGGQGAGFIMAAARGYYRQVGLDVSLYEGKGSAVTAQLVAHGNDTFGLSDAGTAALGISKGEPIKVIADVLQQTPLSFIYHGSERFNDPRDLKGKTVIDSAGTAELSLLPAVLKKYGMTERDIRLEIVQPSAKITAFLKNPNAFVLGFDNGDYLRAKKEDPTAKYTSYGAFGVNPYGIGVVASLAEIQQHPDVVRRFMQASARGWQAAQADPSATVAAILKAFPDANRQIEQQSLAITMKSLHTAATQGKPWGWMAKSDWQQTIDLLHQYVGLKNPKPLSDYYTNAFVTRS